MIFAAAMEQFTAWGWGENDGVAGLQRQHDLVDGGGGGVGGGGDGGDDALGGGHLLHAESLVLGNDAAGLLVAHVVPDMLGGILVLGDLIHHDAVAGLFAGHFGQRDPHFGHGHGRLFADGVHLLLGKGAVRFLRCTDDGKGFLQGLNRVDGQWGRHTRSSFIFDRWVVGSLLVFSCTGKRNQDPNDSRQLLRVRSVGLSSKCSFSPQKSRGRPGEKSGRSTRAFPLIFRYFIHLFALRVNFP